MAAAAPLEFTRRRFLAAAGAGVLAPSLVGTRSAVAQAVPGLNLLHIILDDANDWLGFLGPADPLIGRLVAYTPNLDALAAESLLFERAYCVVPQCAGSRVATLIGVSPERTGIEWDQLLHVVGGSRCDATLGTGCYPTWFGSGLGLAGDLDAAGYRQFSAGKIVHNSKGGVNYAPIPQLTDISRWGTSLGWLKVRAKFFRRLRDRGVAGYLDHPSTNWYSQGPAIDKIIADSLLQQWPEPGAQPWHLVAGFIGSHTPFVVRAAWRRRYEDIPDPTPQRLAREDQEDVPRLGRVGETYADIDQAERLGIIRAYLASLSEADFQIGRLMEQLIRTKEIDRTVVVVWTDHGYSLGHKLHYGKNRLHEQCIRVPLLIRVPGQAGRRVSMPVSLLDLRATLTEILGVAPAGISDSTSLLTLIDAPPDVRDQHEVVSYWEGSRSYRRAADHRIVYRDGTEERYNVASDPAEFVNLAAPAR